MKGVILTGGGEVAIKEFPDPEPGPGQVVIRSKASAICGSDLHVYHMPADRIGKWFGEVIAGHEPAGVVETVGEGVRSVKPGDRVWLYHYLGCGRCKQCFAGNLQWCDEARGYGARAHGGDADFVLTDERNCIPLPDGLSFETGAIMACVAGTGFSALRKLELSGVDTVAVIGLGPVGLAGVGLAKAMGARVIAIGRRKIRLDLARRLGADEVVDVDTLDEKHSQLAALVGGGVEAVYETSGAAEAHKMMLHILARGGRVAMVAGRGPEPTISVSAIVGRQITIRGSFVMPLWMAHDLTRFLAERDVGLDSMVTHRFPLEDAAEAFSLFDSGECGKVMFTWD